MRPLSEIITEYDAVVGQLPQPEMQELISSVAKHWRLLERSHAPVDAQNEAYEKGIITAKIWLQASGSLYSPNMGMGGSSEYEEIIKAQELMEQSGGNNL